MAAAWSLHAYSIEELRSLLSKASTGPWPNDCVHDRYFEDYFAAIGARRILVEHDYIDHDFLEDFAAYYVRCFKDYARKCTRLHFFKSALAEADLQYALERNDAKALARIRG